MSRSGFVTAKSLAYIGPLPLYVHSGVILLYFVPIFESQDMVLKQSPAPTPETCFLNPNSVP